MSAYTTPNFNQNQAGEQYAAQRPTMPGYCFDYNTPFEAMRTPQDQIHWLYKHLRAAPQTDDYSNLQVQIDELKKMLEEHVKYTNSVRGKEILENFEEYLPKFKKIIPYDYKKILNAIAKMEEKGLNPEQAQIEAFYAATR